MSSLFKIFLLLSLTSTNCSAVYLFGCSFRNSSNLRVQDTDAGDIYKPLKAAIFTDADKLNSIVERIGKIMTDTLTDNLFNTVESMHRFWVAHYKFVKNPKNREKSWESFFNRYQPSVVLNSGPLGLLVSILSTFIAEFEQYARNVYFASVYTKAPDAFYKAMPELLKLPPTYKIKATAGVLKFYLKKKLGYILIMIDPEDGSGSHVVIMDQEYDVIKTSGNMRFRKFRSKFPHLIHSSKVVLPSFSSVDTNHYFYNVERPFCFIPKITRGELLNPRRTLIKQDSKGNQLASIYFNVLPLVENPVFHAAYIDKGVQYQTIPFSLLNSKQIDDPEIEKALTSVSEIMGIHKFELCTKLNLYNMLEDEVFMGAYSNLVSKRNPGQNLARSFKTMKKRQRSEKKTNK